MSFNNDNSGRDPIGLKNGIGIPQNPATKEKQDDIISAISSIPISNTLDQYKISNIDADVSPNYYGFEDKDGNWYILKEVVSAGDDTYTYCKGTSAYSTAWTNRASQTYQSFSATF